jgi:hypothetical protein
MKGLKHLTEHVMASRRTTALVRGATMAVVVGLGMALVAPTCVLAQATSAEPTTTQPPQSSDLDANFWALVRDSTDPGALQSYLDSFPSGKFVTQARDRLATLREQQARGTSTPSREASIHNPGVEPSRPAAPPPAENKDLARALQQELKRVGCLGGDADGVWGDQSRSALREFVRHAKLGIAGDEPNVAALDAASASRSRVCPLVCSPSEKAVGDRCVPAVVNKPQPRQVRQYEPRQPQPRRAWAEPTPRETPNSGKRICFGAARNEIVACP